MPGFATHYLFGVDAYRKLSSTRLKDNLKKQHSAFALGLQGPDLFFYYLPSYLLHKRNLGALAHDSNTGAFFANLIAGRSLFAGHRRQLEIADAYILGFLGHYTLDCTVHPYVYAQTGYTPLSPPGNLEYFGRHAYLETEIDNILLQRRKHICPSQFSQGATIRLRPLQKKVIVQLLVYAYRNTYPGTLAANVLLSGAPLWMRLGTKLFRDPTGQKKVLARLFERITLGRAFLSPMVPSDRYRFIRDPLNQRRRTWKHPWSRAESGATFSDLYQRALNQYMTRIQAYTSLAAEGFPEQGVHEFMSEYGNRSFLSGMACT